MVFRGVRYGSGRASPQDHPILTLALANSVFGTVRAAVAVATLVALAAGWAALITWSATDPSFTRVGVETPRNILGATGAYLADLVLQALGFASFVLLLAPMFWATAMLRGTGGRAVLLSLLAYPASIAGLAMAAAYWRTVPGWPLTTGLGGLSGDHLLASAVALLVPFIGESARPAAAAAAGFGGIVACYLACGFTVPARRSRKASKADRRLREPLFESPLSHAPDTDTRRWRPDPLEPVISGFAVTGGPRQAADVVRPATAQPATVQRAEAQFGPYAAAIVQPNGELGDQDSEFEAMTDTSSSGMAARFAPAGNAPRAMQDAVTTAFGFATGRSRPPSSPSQQAASAWRRPSLNLLTRLAVRSTSAYVNSLNRGNARLATDALSEFGIAATLHDIEPGPVVTTFLFKISRDTSADRAIALSPDIAHHIGVPALRMHERRGLIAIEWPNAERSPVVLRDCLESEAWRSELDTLPLALGLSTTGAPVIADLAQLSGMLVSGAEASSRATGLNAMILSLVYRHGPEDCRLLLIDPRMVDLPAYDGMPHLLTPVVSDPKKAITALSWCVREMEERVKRMSFLGVRNIELFNNRVRYARKRGERLQRTIQTGFDETTGEARIEKRDIDLTPMPYIVIVIEELGDLMAVAGREIEGSIGRLAKAARSVGIHLIVATDRPTPDIVTTSIRESLPARLSYRTEGRAESRLVIGEDGAEQLLAGGDSLLWSATAPVVRLHGPAVSAEEVMAVATSLRDQGPPQDLIAMAEGPATPGADTWSAGAAAQADYAIDGQGSVPLPPSATNAAQSGTIGAAAPPPLSPAEELYDRAVAVAVRDGGASIGHLQGALKVSASWAAYLLTRLEADGVIERADSRGIHTLRRPGTRVA